MTIIEFEPIYPLITDSFYRCALVFWTGYFCITAIFPNSYISVKIK